MRERPDPGPRLGVLFLAGTLLLNYPLLSLFSRDGMVAGFPVLYLYVFTTWAALIALLATVVHRRPG